MSFVDLPGLGRSVVGPLLVQGAMVFALGLVAAALLRRASSSTRALVFRLTVLILVLTPFLRLAVPPASFTLEDAAVRVADRVLAVEPPGAEGGAAVVELNGAVESSTSSSKQGVTGLSTAWAWLIVLIWAVGVGVGFARFAMSTLRLIALRRASHHARRGSPAVQQLERLRRELRVGKQVELLLSDRTRVPLAAGIVRPVIILPAGATEWSAERTRIVLIHELEHVRRWDWATLMALECVTILHWLDPLAWLARARARAAIEHAADEFVLDSGIDPLRYADELLALALSAKAPAVVAPGLRTRGSALGRRVDAILGGATRSHRSISRTPTLLAAVLALVIAVSIAAVPVSHAADSNAIPVADPQPGTPSEHDVAQNAQDLGNPLDRSGSPMLDTLLYAEQPESRVFAASRLRADAPAIVPRLVAAFGDTCTAIRWRAVRGLRDLRAPDAVPALVNLVLDDRNPDVRAMAANAIATSGPNTGALLLRRALARADAVTLDRVAHALATLRGSPVHATLMRAIVPDPTARTSH